MTREHRQSELASNFGNSCTAPWLRAAGLGVLPASQRAVRAMREDCRLVPGLAQVRKEAIGPLLGQRADHWRGASQPKKATEHLQEKSEAKAG
jgi:hypothetical protein